MARNRSQTGAKAAAEARKRLARTVGPAERALGAFIEASSAEAAAHVAAVESLATLAGIVGVDQAAALSEVSADEVRRAVDVPRPAGPGAGRTGSAAGVGEGASR